MQTDKQRRLIIPKAIRKISSVAKEEVVALMMETPKKFYIVPEEQAYEGKMITRCSLDRGRIIIPKEIYSKDAEYIIYLQRGVIFIEKI